MSQQRCGDHGITAAVSCVCGARSYASWAASSSSRRLRAASARNPPVSLTMAVPDRRRTSRSH
ncbi:hypothetical protein ABZ297_25935 [Nonomuraea sp. NPDC005983]|uniref:hypothetical protein n=1 Tax=Nonomuraea sp. NPDC005983 TaxID=3155595 RepID=UPI00339DB2B8